MSTEAPQSPDINLVGFLTRHLVGIYVTLAKDGEEPTSILITTFVISVGNRWFLATAGHCLETIIDALGAGYTIVEPQLVDSLRPSSGFKNTLPYVLNVEEWECATDGPDVDYGVIPLSNYYREHLKNNKIEPLTEEVWKTDPPYAGEFKLLGIPAQLVVKKDPSKLSIAVTLHQVTMIDQRPTAFPETDAPLIYGKIELGAGVTDIRGMSGGPLFVFCETRPGEFRYWLVGLQSSWLASSQYIKAYPTFALGNALEQMIRNGLI